MWHHGKYISAIWAQDKSRPAADTKIYDEEKTHMATPEYFITLQAMPARQHMNSSNECVSVGCA